MLGQRLNLFILLLTTLLSCGKAPEHSGAPQFVKGHILTPGDGSGLSLDRRATRTWRDYDGDGLSDRFDWDIDGDGVANLIDQFPFDEKRWGEDLNKNGITDFIDLKILGDSNFTYQEEIFQLTGVVVIEGSDKFSQAEWMAMREIMASEQLTNTVEFSKIKTIVKYDKNDQLDFRRADFDSYWQQMNFYTNELHIKSLKAFRGSMIHEFGHVHALENPEKYLSFVNAYPTWSSPSQHGKTSPEEGYAEDFALQLFQAGLELDPARFDLL